MKTLVLPVVLYGCETWSLTLSEERRRRVFENRALGRIFGSKRDEVTREWVKVCNEELNNLCSSLNIVSGDQIKKNEIGGACSTHGERRCAYRVLVGNHEGKKPLRNAGVDGRIILR